MPTGDQPLDPMVPLYVALITMFLGIALFIIGLLQMRKAGPSRRSRHRKGARFHKPTHIPVKEAHPHQPVQFIQAHVHRTRSIHILPTTAVMPKIEVRHANRKRALR